MTTHNAVVRPAVLGDEAGIARVHVDSWRETYSGVVPPRFFGAEDLAARERLWSSILNMDPLPGSIVVAEDQSHIVGFAFAGPSSHPDATKGVEPARALHLFSIYLMANEQGAGIGRDLLEAAISDRPTQLWVLASNERARSFYRRHGFEADGVEVADPDLDEVIEIRMIR